MTAVDEFVMNLACWHITFDFAALSHYPALQLR